MIEIRRILCPTDFSTCSQHALQCAATAARWYKARLTVLHISAQWPLADMIPSIGVGAIDAVAMRRSDRQALARHLWKSVAPYAANDDVETVLDEATDVAQHILTRAEDLAADLIVMGTHGRTGFERLLVGSVAEEVLRKAQCPVMVVPPRVHDPVLPPGMQVRQIVCAIDFADCSLNAVAYALSLAEEADAHLTLLNVIDVPPGLMERPMILAYNTAQLRSTVETERLRRLRLLIPDAATRYCSVEPLITVGMVDRQILEIAAARKADLIVMGVHGRGALDLAGSTTRKVIEAAECPVLTLRG